MLLVRFVTPLGNKGDCDASQPLRHSVYAEGERQGERERDGDKRPHFGSLVDFVPVRSKTRQQPF